MTKVDQQYLDEVRRLQQALREAHEQLGRLNAGSADYASQRSAVFKATKKVLDYERVIPKLMEEQRRPALRSTGQSAIVA